MHKRKENEHSEGVERERPSPPALELDPAAISGSLMMICSRAATSVQWRREHSVEVEGDGSDADGSASMAVRLPAAPALPLDRLGFRDVGEGAGGAANLVSCAWPPHPSLYCAVQRGPTNH